MRLIAVLALALAGCGLDGPPERPVDDEERPSTGITVSGDARAGVVAY